MKKLLTLLVFLSISFGVFSQDETSLTNKNGITILPEKGDISIAIDGAPFLNMLNDKGDSPGFNFINNAPIISLKYLITSKSALRFEIVADYIVDKIGDDSFNYYEKDVENSFGFGFGYEKRRGESRLQGFYGVQAGMIWGKSKYSDSDDNTFDELSSLSFNTNGFIGVELFVIPKLSIGGQFMWGPSYTIVNDKLSSVKETYFDISSKNINGALMISFYF